MSEKQKLYIAIFIGFIGGVASNILFYKLLGKYRIESMEGFDSILYLAAAIASGCAAYRFLPRTKESAYFARPSDAQKKADKSFIFVGIMTVIVCSAVYFALRYLGASPEVSSYAAIFFFFAAPALVLCKF